MNLSSQISTEARECTKGHSFTPQIFIKCWRWTSLDLLPTNFVIKLPHFSGPWFLQLLKRFNWIIPRIPSNINILWLLRKICRVENWPEMATLGEETTEDKKIMTYWSPSGGGYRGFLRERSNPLIWDWKKNKHGWLVGWKWGILAEALARAVVVWGWQAGCWVRAPFL